METLDAFSAVAVFHINMGCVRSKAVETRTAKVSIEPLRSSYFEQFLPKSFSGDISKWYTFDTTLGYGQYGTVRLARSVYHPEEAFAVKTICYKRLGTRLDCIRREIAILFSLDHPNIIRLYEVYEEPKYFHLVTEYCSGGELFDRLVSKGHYQEAEAATLFRKILGAIAYLHSRGVCHRDLKPENFMFESDELKLIDFGLAAKMETPDTIAEMHSQVGTAFYVAPEVLKGPYTFKCDIWSAGIMLYLMLTGTAPIPGKHSEELLHALSTFKLDTNVPALSKASPQVRDLLRSLLSRNPEDRPTALEALSHPWFDSHSVQEHRLDPAVLCSLKRFRATSRLKAAALGMIARRLGVRRTEDASSTFAAMDTSSNGTIDVEELEAALSNAGFALSQVEIQAIMSNLDLSGTGQIKYSDFLAATLACKSVLSEATLRKTFSLFDTENSGYITRTSLQEAMLRTGRVLANDEAAGIIAEADVLNEGKISYSAFERILQEAA